MSNMAARELIRTRVVYSERSFAELVLWSIDKPVQGSHHNFKYRLAYIVDGTCVLRFDNEAGKGDHVHVGRNERTYRFTTPTQLVADFNNAIGRWNDENGDT
jgi:hypothetical protein